MTASQRTITVVICTRNRAASLERTLMSFSGQMDNPALARIVVVDNGSTDETGHVIAEFESRYPDMVVKLFEPRGGKSYALNTGIGACFSDVLAFTDDDVIVPDGWIAEIDFAAQAYPDCDVFGGRVEPVLPEGVTMPDWVHRIDPYNIAEGPLCDHDKGGVVRSYHGDGMCTPVGANVVIRRRLLDMNWRFDPRQESRDGSVPMSEDSIFFNRLKNAGVEMLYVPSMRVCHVTEPDRLTKQYFRTYFRKSARSVIRASETIDGSIRIFNVPWYFYRRLAFKGCLWLAAWLRLEARGLRFARELDFIYLSAVVKEYFDDREEVGA